MTVRFRYSITSTSFPQPQPRPVRTRIRGIYRISLWITCADDTAGVYDPTKDAGAPPLRRESSRGDPVRWPPKPEPVQQCNSSELYVHNIHVLSTTCLGRRNPEEVSIFIMLKILFAFCIPEFIPQLQTVRRHALRVPKAKSVTHNLNFKNKPRAVINAVSQRLHQKTRFGSFQSFLI